MVFHFTCDEHLSFFTITMMSSNSLNRKTAPIRWSIMYHIIHGTIMYHIIHGSDIGINYKYSTKIAIDSHSPKLEGHLDITASKKGQVTG